MDYLFRHEKRQPPPDPDYYHNVIMRKSNHTYSINNKITQIFTSNSWLNKRCFILGGGESLKNFDFSILKGELIISINRGFEFCPHATINYAMDSMFYEKMKRGEYRKVSSNMWAKWEKFSGVKVFLSPLEIREFGKEVYLIRRNLKPSINREHLDDGIYGGTNSGVGAINLAVALGANLIYLLGYDMEAKTQTHWHGGYGDERKIFDFNIKLERFKKEIETMAPKYLNGNIKIINLNPNSNLKIFPFLHINEVLNI